MRDYEIVYIFRSNLTPEEIEAKLERYHAIITEGGQGEITAVVQWGKRQLAYPIQKQPNGHYVVAQFTSPPQPLTELERVLKLEDDVLRYLVVISEGEMPLPEVSHHTRAASVDGEPAAKPDEAASEAASDETDAAAAVEEGAATDAGEDGAEAVGGAEEDADAADPVEEGSEAVGGAEEDADAADPVEEGSEAAGGAEEDAGAADPVGEGSEAAGGAEEDADAADPEEADAEEADAEEEDAEKADADEREE